MYHNPVMVNQCIEGLQINPDGIYVDVTFGGGGHSMRILENLREGRLIAFDQDEDASNKLKIYRVVLLHFVRQTSDT
jgi:16S rRNA (cytosine1402-N4)-methyltransferase